MRIIIIEEDWTMGSSKKGGVWRNEKLRHTPFPTRTACPRPKAANDGKSFRRRSVVDDPGVGPHRRDDGFLEPVGIDLTHQGLDILILHFFARLAAGDHDEMAAERRVHDIA